jgi:predicted dienelactone hydrolase
MRTILTILISFLLASPATSAGPTNRYAPGILDLEGLGTPERPALSGYLWYPAERDGSSMQFGENAVFEGVDAIPGAAIGEGRFPLVVLSHGLDGNALNQAWLARTLAMAGYVVVAPNHPGTTTWDRDAALRARLSERPGDLSRAIDAALAHPIVGAAIDRERIAAVGHSLGGWTVTALAGARLDHARHANYCHENATRRTAASP